MHKVGVVIGRYQVPDLHEGHKDVLNMALKENGKLLVILGNSPLINTIPDPLDYVTREKMIKFHYPNAIVTFVRNQETDEKWSEEIDKVIREICPIDKPTLYGGRDSFIPFYHGKHKCEKITSFHETSGTELRESVGQVVLDTPDFRKGIIYAAYNRFPNIRVTVDIAVLKDRLESDRETKVLLGTKYNSDFWRFPGGFVDYNDKSFEETAKRELREEVGLIETGNWDYIGSCRVDDWRYKGVDGEYIMTNFYICDYVFGCLNPSDDLEKVAWFSLKDLFDGKLNMVECHLILIDELKNYIEKTSLKIKDPERIEHWESPKHK